MARYHHEDDYEQMLIEYYLDAGGKKPDDADTYRAQYARIPGSDVRAAEADQGGVRL